jgi:hypothetical protein
MHAAKAGHVPGLSPNVAGKLLDETSEKRKSKFAKAFRGRVTGRRDVTGHNDVTGRSIY